MRWRLREFRKRRLIVWNKNREYNTKNEWLYIGTSWGSEARRTDLVIGERLEWERSCIYLDRHGLILSVRPLLPSPLMLHLVQKRWLYGDLQNNQSAFRKISALNLQLRVTLRRESSDNRFTCIAQTSVSPLLCKLGSLKGKLQWPLI